MDNLFVMLFLISTLALIIGLIKPNIVLSWSPVAKRNRRYVAMYFGIATVVFFILIALTAPPANESSVKSEQIELGNKDQTEIEGGQAKKEAEEQAKKAAEEQAKKEAEEQAKKEAGEQAKKEAEEQARKAAEEQAKKAAEEQAKKAAEEQAKKAAEEQARKAAGTTSQQQAVRMAKDYLAYTAFSKKGLIEQLVFEGFSNEDASFAVEKISVDWKEQAAKMAKNYLDYTSFSRSGLIEQLVFEGFSNEDATYGADSVGL